MRSKNEKVTTGKDYMPKEHKKGGDESQNRRSKIVSLQTVNLVKKDGFHCQWARKAVCGKG